MTRRSLILAILFRCLGVSAMLAVIPVVMPLDWMIETHRWLGLGTMPTAPVVEYLARTLSAFYALFGALCLVIATDIERYRPLIRFLGAAFVALGVAFTGIDIAAGMPWWWSSFEGPPGVLLGLAVFTLAAPEPTEAGKQ